MRLRHLPVLALLWVAAVAGQGLAADCAEWTSGWFFESATLAEVRECLEAGAELEAGGNLGFGITPLHSAAAFTDNPGVIWVLIGAGADVNARSLTGTTPLHHAADNNHNPAIIRALIGAGSRVDVQDEYGTTPLHHAALANDNPVVIWVLLAAGAKVNARSLIGTTPLHHAALANDNPAIITALVNAGADITAPLEARAGVDVRFPFSWTPGWTPLHFAAFRNNNPAVIWTLIGLGADAAARDADGKTPWDYAQDNEALEGTDIWRRLREGSLE